MAPAQGCFTGQCGVEMGGVPTDGLDDPYGESYPDAVVDTYYDNDGVLQYGNPNVDEEDDEGLLGLLNNVVDSVQDTLQSGQKAVVDVFKGGQQAVVDVADRAGETLEHGQDAFKDAAKDAFNPWNFLAGAFGASVGGTLAVGAFAVGGAAIADELLTGGAGRIAISRRLFGRGRR